ncbi:MAG: hypothetical protein WC787_04420 [Patescibacteria group bacterium]|jgi:hypothetical protein
MKKTVCILASHRDILDSNWTGAARNIRKFAEAYGDVTKAFVWTERRHVKSDMLRYWDEQQDYDVQPVTRDTNISVRMHRKATEFAHAMCDGERTVVLVINGKLDRDLILLVAEMRVSHVRTVAIVLNENPAREDLLKLLDVVVFYHDMPSGQPTWIYPRSEPNLLPPIPLDVFDQLEREQGKIAKDVEKILGVSTDSASNADAVRNEFLQRIRTESAPLSDIPKAILAILRRRPRQPQWSTVIDVDRMRKKLLNYGILEPTFDIAVALLCAEGSLHRNSEHMIEYARPIDACVHGLATELWEELTVNRPRKIADDMISAIEIASTNDAKRLPIEILPDLRRYERIRKLDPLARRRVYLAWGMSFDDMAPFEEKLKGIVGEHWKPLLAPPRRVPSLPGAPKRPGPDPPTKKLQRAS